MSNTAYDIATLRSVFDKALSLSPGERIELAVEDINNANTVRGILYKERNRYERATGINSNIRIQRDARRGLVILSKDTIAKGSMAIITSGGERTLLETAPTDMLEVTSTAQLSADQLRILECMVSDGWDRDEAIAFLSNEEA